MTTVTLTRDGISTTLIFPTLSLHAVQTLIESAACELNISVIHHNTIQQPICNIIKKNG